MALSLSTAVKNKASYLLYSVAYATLGGDFRSSLIDGEGASALVELETWAQWFTYTTAAGNAPDEWEPWFVTRIVCRIQANAHPDQSQVWEKRDRDAMQRAMESYARRAMTFSPSASESFVFSVLNNRIYVLNHCTRLRPALFPTIESVDSALSEVLTEVWNRGTWAFARRPCRINFRRTAFTGMSWNSASLTLTTTNVDATVPTGTKFYVTDGTDTVTGEYSIASTTATTIVLTSNVIDAGVFIDPTDVEGFYVLPVFHGLGASETFDSIATTSFSYTDASHEGDILSWQTADDFAKIRARTGINTARPVCFRTHQPTATGTVFMLSPPPDQDYTVLGEVIVRQPANPTSTSSTTTFDAFAKEFMPCMRRAQLDRVLTNYNRTNDQLHREVRDEIEARFPVYQDPGEPDNRVGITDVYHDREDQRFGVSMLRGGEGAI